MAKELDITRLRGMIGYDVETGEFTWLVSRGTVKAGRSAGRICRQGYRVIKIDSQYWQAHRLAWAIAYGSFPENEIDHINGNRSDNRIANLRDVSKEVNQQNRHRARSDNISGFQGVFKHKDCDRWVAQIMAGKKQRYLGLFQTPEEAHAAYLRAKSELHATREF